MKAEIRTGLDQDVDRCVDLWTRVIAARDGQDAAPRIAERARAAFARSLVRFAVIGAAPEAFALTVVAQARTALLSRICVDPSAESRGLGSALIADAIAHAQHGGFDRLDLDVRTTNVRAVELYARAGFRPISRPWTYDEGDPVVSWSLDLMAEGSERRSGPPEA